MAEHHGAPEAGQLPGVWSRSRTDRESPKSERRRVRSWTVQNEMRVVLKRVSAGAAGRILDSANLREKNLSILSMLKRKEWPQCHRENSWQVRRSHICQKGKEQNRQSRVPHHEGGESQGERDPHLREREGDQSESMGRKGWTPQ